MKNFMSPRSYNARLFREHHESERTFTPTPSPNSKSKPPQNPRSKPPKSGSNENAPPPSPLDLNATTTSPSAGRIKSPLPPRPPLKRKLSVESSDTNSNAAHTSSDSGVKVIIRVKPPTKDEEDGGNIIQKVAEDSLSISGQTFTYDSIADVHSKQIDIFELVGAPLVENCLSGFNSSVFAYGQTGSGKTYTIWGASNALLDEDQQGLAPRVLRRLFERIEEEQIKQADGQLVYMCRCSFLEIYNEQITDLLDPGQKYLQIREDVKTGVYVENLREECVSSMKDVSQLLMKGLSNRRTSATCVNAESSRSHSVFTCVVESRSKSAADGLSYLKVSRMNFVDLAGSERQKQTGAAGERLKEAGNINRSLSQLGNLINILAEISQTGKPRHIPYRDSKLTFLLQESLGGNAKLAMICAISPSTSCKSETLSTLRFAQRAKAIKNRAVINEEMQNDVGVLREMVRQLRDELKRMKANQEERGVDDGAYATGWSARRSLNLLRYSLNRPMILPNAGDDSDEEMEIVDIDESMPVNPETKHSSLHDEDTDVNMEDESFKTVGMDETVTGKNPETLHPDGSTPQERNEESISLAYENLANDCGSCEQVEKNNSMELPRDAENTPEKATNYIQDGAALRDVSIIPGDISPVLKSPIPSVSPRVNNSRKSLRTSSATSASQSFPTLSNIDGGHVSTNLVSTRKSFLESTEHLAASLRRGLDVIKSQSIRPGGPGRSSFRFSCMPSDVKAVIPVLKVDVGVQTFCDGDESVNKDTEEVLCHKCKASTIFQQESKEDNDGQCMQLVPVDDSSQSRDKCKNQLPKAVEKVLAGAIRREMALEEICSKQNAEIIKLNRLIQQYKHERECNSIIGQTREDKIARLEGLMDGVVTKEDFMEDELLSLTQEHKILKAQYDNHPDVLRTKIELKRVQDELERYQNFFDLGERDVLLEEIQDLRTQLHSFLDSSSKTSKKQVPLLQLISSHEPTAASALSDTPQPADNVEERLEQERRQWTETESKWISLVEELRVELESSRSVSQKQKQELDTEKRCCEELKEAMQMAMEGHARMLEQYAELEERHMQLLARHRKIQEGIDDVKKAAARAGVRSAESKFINSLAAEISVLKAEREKERQYFRDEKIGLQTQLRDTAEAVQAAGELLVRLKEAEEAVAAAEKRAIMAEHETESAYKEIDKLNKLVAASHLPKEEFAANEIKEGGDQKWREEFAQYYDDEPSSWFSGYDRCNI